MIYDRQTSSYIEEKVYASGKIHFLYNTFVGGLLRMILRLRPVSAIYGTYQNTRRSARKINKFINECSIDPSRYYGEYTTFNEFFTRRPKKVYFPQTANHLAAPADSVLTALRIQKGIIFSIKGRSYTLARFLQNKKLAESYENGWCLIFRLRVFDCHRFYFFDQGQITGRKKISGVLDSVNTSATNIFSLCSNCRELTLMQTRNFGEIVYAEVGAMLVGKIVNTHTDKQFFRGQEKGYFEFGGSTIVVLIKNGQIKLDSDIEEHLDSEIMVYLGEKIGNRYP